MAGSVTVPLSAPISPAIRRNRVDLPAPFAPTSPIAARRLECARTLHRSGGARRRVRERSSIVSMGAIWPSRAGVAGAKRRDPLPMRYPVRVSSNGQGSRLDGVFNWTTQHYAGHIADLAGPVTLIAIDRAGAESFLTPMDVRPDPSTRAPSLRFDEPAARQRHHPLRLRAFMPFADPADRQNEEEDSVRITGGFANPQRRCLAADAPGDESRELTVRHAAGAIPPGPHAVIRHARRIGVVSTVAGGRAKRQERHRHLPMLATDRR